MNEINFEDLDKYCNNEIPSEKKEFIEIEKEISSNKELKKKYKLLKEINVALQDIDALELRSKFEAIHRKNINTQHKKIVPLYKKYWIAAAAVITLFLIVSGILVINRNSNKVPSGEQLYSFYYNRDNLSSNTTRSNNNRSETNNLVNKAYVLYENENYSKAIEFFQKAKIENPSDFSVRLFLGISFMETSDYEKAITELSYILNNRPNLYTEKAEWYLGLCYLKTNNIEKAKQQFTLISKNQYHFYREKAMEILNKMK
jgi:tetratricopeptide (TPR) repeat protein